MVRVRARVRIRVRVRVRVRVKVGVLGGALPDFVEDPLPLLTS